MLELMLYGVISALAVFIILMKLPLRKILGYDVAVDIAFTIMLAWILSGSFAGMMAALIGGLLLSIVLAVTKKLLGYEKIELNGWHPTWRRYK